MPATPRLLVINPNTSSLVTQRLAEHCTAVLGDDMQVRSETARFGANYIANEVSYAIAAHAVIERWAECAQDEQRKPDAVLIGCFGDPGLAALRENAGVPVTGLAEAAFTEARHHGRFAIVTGGERWRPMLQRLGHELGFADYLRHIHTVRPTGDVLAAQPEQTRQLLIEACREAARTAPIDAIILGGAGLAGIAATLQPALDLPIIDSVHAGARHALRCWQQAATRPRITQTPPPISELRWQAVSDAICHFGQDASVSGNLT